MSIDDTHCPGIRKAPRDSGVFILSLSTSRRALECLGLSLASTSGEAWGLETGDYKTQEILHFRIFLLRSLTEGIDTRGQSWIFLKGLVS